MDLPRTLLLVWYYLTLRLLERLEAELHAEDLLMGPAENWYRVWQLGLPGSGEEGSEWVDVFADTPMEAVDAATPYLDSALETGCEVVLMGTPSNYKDLYGEDCLVISSGLSGGFDLGDRISLGPREWDRFANN